MGAGLLQEGDNEDTIMMACTVDILGPEMGRQEAQVVIEKLGDSEVTENGVK